MKTGKTPNKTLKLLAGVSLLLGVLFGPAVAQDKPAEIKVGITTVHVRRGRPCSACPARPRPR